MTIKRFGGETKGENKIRNEGKREHFWNPHHVHETYHIGVATAFSR